MWKTIGKVSKNLKIISLDENKAWKWSEDRETKIARLWFSMWWVTDKVILCTKRKILPLASDFAIFSFHFNDLLWKSSWKLCFSMISRSGLCEQQCWTWRDTVVNGLRLSQNHRILWVGRDLYGSSSPNPLPKQSCLQQAAQDLV